MSAVGDIGHFNIFIVSEFAANKMYIRVQILATIRFIGFSLNHSLPKFTFFFLKSISRFAHSQISDQSAPFFKWQLFLFTLERAFTLMQISSST